MKTIKFGFIIALLATIVTSCKSYDDDNKKEKEILNEDNSSTDNRCKDISVDDFDTFLGVQFQTSESELKEVMGKSTGGGYNNDSTAFMYYYKNTKRVPVTVFVDAQTGTVETIFMEILGLNGNFDQDVQKADEDFNIEQCHLDLFGKQPKDIIGVFGQADKDNIEEDSVEESVRHLVYYSSDDKIALSFKFYKSQDNKMSSFMVDWFH
jgi:hypothetical protein